VFVKTSTVAAIGIALVGELGLGVLLSPVVRPARTPAFTVDPPTGRSFAIVVPPAGRGRIDAVAADLGVMDLPAVLEREAPAYRPVAEAWRQAAGRVQSWRFGDNVVNVYTVIPRLRAVDPSDALAVAAAEAMNQDVERVVGNALTRRASSQ
jgi:hypothetical protein